MNTRFVQLSDVCDLQNGFAFKSTDYVEKSNTCNIRMSNIRPGGSFNEFHNERYLPDSYAQEYKDYLLNDGDLIIAMTDMATETKILGLPTLVNNTSGRNFLLNQRVGKLCKFSKDIYVPYLRHILTAQDVIDYYKSKGAGGLQINISKKDILSVKFPLPAIPTQQKIVAKLDALFAEIDTATAAAMTNANNAEALFQSYLTEVFDKQTKENKNVTVGEMCLIINGGTPKSEVSEYWNGDLNWITPKEMGKLIGREIYSTERKITDKGIKNSSAKLLPINSIILSSRAPIGHLAINKELMATNQGCKGLVPKESLNYEYLYYFLLKSKELLNDMGSGTTFKELSGTKLATVILPLPNILIQKNTVRTLDMIFSQVQIAKNSFKLKQKNLTLLKQSFLQQAFSGELVKD